VVLGIPAQPAQPVQPVQQPLEPLEDDLGMVDNIFQVLNAPQQLLLNMVEDVIVASSDSVGAPEDIPPKPQVELIPVANLQDVLV
jgi:hypothetical protein